MNLDTLVFGFYLVVVAAVGILASRKKEESHDAIIDRSFSPEILAEMRARPFYLHFGFWSAILVACVVALYIRFA